MKARIILGIVIGLGLAFWLFAYSCNKESEMTSITRPYQEYDYAILEPPPLPAAGEGSPSSLDIKTINEINGIREKEGLENLDFDLSLGAVARVRAEECAEKFSHTRPDGSQWYTVNETIMFGENLAYGYDTAEEVVDAWMNSPAHKDLLLDNEFTSCGIGSYEEDGTTYMACEFGY